MPKEWDEETRKENKAFRELIKVEQERDDARAELNLLRQLLCAKEGESSEQLGHRVAYQLCKQKEALESIAGNKTYEMSGDVYEKMRDMVKEALK